MDRKVIGIAEDIKEMKIRGGAKIGRTVTEGLKIEAENYKGMIRRNLYEILRKRPDFFLQQGQLQFHLRMPLDMS